MSTPRIDTYTIGAWPFTEGTVRSECDGKVADAQFGPDLRPEVDAVREAEDAVRRLVAEDPLRQR